MVPAHESPRLEAIAGLGSELYEKHGLYLQHVGVVTVPEDYETRLGLMFPSAYARLRLFGLDPNDLALSKLERNSRYRDELRPYLANEERHDLTIRLWKELLLSPPGSAPAP